MNIYKIKVYTRLTLWYHQTYYIVSHVEVSPKNILTLSQVTFLGHNLSVQSISSRQHFADHKLLDMTKLATIYKGFQEAPGDIQILRSLERPTQSQTRKFSRKTGANTLAQSMRDSDMCERFLWNVTMSQKTTNYSMIIDTSIAAMKKKGKD